MATELSKYQRTLIWSRADGPALTAAAAASCLPTSGAAKHTFDAGYFGVVGKAIRIRADGRISVVVTTPGTARYSVRFTGPTGTVVTVADTLAMDLNIVAKTNVRWDLDMTLVCDAVGSATAKMWTAFGSWRSEAVEAAVAASAGSQGVNLFPWNTAPVTGANTFDGTVQQSCDLFFEQTVATGSMTLHNFELTALN